jgi:hypothetical protein
MDIAMLNLRQSSLELNDSIPALLVRGTKDQRVEIAGPVLWAKCNIRIWSNTVCHNTADLIIEVFLRETIRC